MQNPLRFKVNFILFHSLILFALLQSTCTNPARPDESLPIVQLIIDGTEMTIDDYILLGSANRKQCTATLVNHQSFSSNINVRIQEFISPTGARIEFAATAGAAGSSTLLLGLPANGSPLNFYVIGVANSTAPGAVYGDVAIEVVENRVGLDEVLLARKALMVAGALPSIPAAHIEVEIANTNYTIDDYITWSPKACRIRIANPAAIGTDQNVTLSNESYGGQIAFGTNSTITPHVNTATATTLNLTLPSNGDWVPFFIAGQFNSGAMKGFSSNRDKDAILVVRQGGNLLGRWATMIRARKNANLLSDDERDRFLEVLVQLNRRFLGRWDEFVGRHQIGGAEAHQGPGFLPWHRAYVLQMERELQAIDPSVSLHYWRFDQPAPKVFHQDFMGNSFGTSAPYNVSLSAGNPLNNWITVSTPGIIRRSLFSPTQSPADNVCGFTPTGVLTTESEAATLARGGAMNLFSSFRSMEGNPHGRAHVAAGGVQCFSPFNEIGYLSDVTISPRDPLFFMLHSNVDHLWAKWQWVFDRLDYSATNAYTPQGAYPATCSAIHIGHWADDEMWPWNQLTGAGLVASCATDDRPVTSSTLRAFPQTIGQFLAPPPKPRPKDMIDYRSIRVNTNDDPVTSINAGMGFCYDDVNY